ncbi:MAG: holo-ACP synthase [Anaerolineae bacterium]|nr:holo-ACP synthase [Anaerolineae bacterium]
MLRIGVDLIEVSRIEHSLAQFGDRFTTRLYTPRERAYCGSNPQRLAARFAAKEAVAKALGTGIGDVRWLDIEIDGDERGRPILLLHGAAAQLAADLGLTAWEVSLSHTNSHAIAFVIASNG